MWGDVPSDEKEDFLQKAIEFTGDHELYGSYMMKVVKEWKYSCEHNLSFSGHNRRAWVGHAACAYAFQCPEDIVRKAWWYLTDEQRRVANRQADKAIEYWEIQYFESPVS